MDPAQLAGPTPTVGETERMAARRGNAGDPTTRNALLDAAARVMTADGYAAATSRRVAEEAGVNSALVFYYFGSLEGMFVALFERGAERSFERLREALDGDQPLWGFWDLIHDPRGSALTMELIALANHHHALREEIASHSRALRAAQIEALTAVLADHGVDPDRFPATVVVLTMSSISRFLLMEEAFDIHEGHAETAAAVEEFIAGLEGPRGATRAAG